MYLTELLGYSNVVLTKLQQMKIYAHLFKEVDNAGLYFPITSDKKTTSDVFEYDGIIYGLNKYQNIAYYHLLNLTESKLINTVTVKYYKWNNDNKFYNYSNTVIYFDKTTATNEIISSSSLPVKLYKTWKKSSFYDKAIYHPIDDTAYLAVNMSGTYIITEFAVTPFEYEYNIKTTGIKSQMV